MNKLLKEPVFWFLLCGGTIFFVERWLSPQLDEQHHIVVDLPLQQQIRLQQEALLDRPVTDAELTELIDRFIDEEVLVREAFQREIDRYDPRIRLILLEKISFLLGGAPQDPDEESLRNWYLENAAVFQQPATRSLDHVFFSEMPPFPGAVLKNLEAGIAPDTLGEAFWLGNQLDAYTEANLEAILGESFALFVFESPLVQWLGPVESERGVHFIRIESEQPSSLPSFEQVRPGLLEIWSAQQREAQLARRRAMLRSEYTVSIESEHTDQP